MSMSNPDFDARLARIASGKGSSKSTLYVGMDEVYQVSYPNRGKAAGASASSSGILYPIALLIAFGVGAASHGGAAWIRFQLMGYGAGSGDIKTEYAIQAGSALVVALVLGTILGFRSRQTRVVMALGAIAALVLMHNAVHLYPAEFAQAFSAEWVEVVKASTTPRTAVFMGHAVSF